MQKLRDYNFILIKIRLFYLTKNVILTYSFSIGNSEKFNKYFNKKKKLKFKYYYCLVRMHVQLCKIFKKKKIINIIILNYL